MKTKLLGGLLLTGVVFAFPVHGQDYEIRLHRPDHKGDKFNYVATGRKTGSMTMKAIADGKILRQNKMDFIVEMKSVATVLSVSPSGQSMSESHVIGELAKTENGKRQELLAKGSTVVISKQGRKRVFQVNGKPADPNVEDALGVVMNVSDGGATDDELFGTTQRKKVGESWPVNGEKMAKQLGSDAEMLVKDVAGRVTLKEVLKDTTGQVLVISADVSAHANPPLAPGLVAQEAALKWHASGKFPIDISKGRPEESMDMAMTLRAKGKQSPNEPELEINATGNQTVTIKRTPVK